MEDIVLVKVVGIKKQGIKQRVWMMAGKCREYTHKNNKNKYLSLKQVQITKTQLHNKITQV